jgi:hypothetical protein
MLKKIKRKDCLEQYPLFPQVDVSRDKYDYPNTVAGFVLAVPFKSTRGHAKALAKELLKVVNGLRIDSLIFLGDYKTAWLYQENNYKPVKAALEYLSDNNVGKRFDGGLEVYTSELPDFLVHLFWLQRCNAALPDFYFMNTDQQFVGHICKYGNLHLDIIDAAIVFSVTDAISKTEFQYTDLSQCGGGSIQGRQIII